MATPPKDPTDTPTASPKPPAPRKPATPRKAAAPRKTARTTAATSTPKPATRKPAAPRTAAAKPATPSTAAKKPAARRSPAKPKAAPAGTSKWGLAAVIGGVGAALTAGLLALRGSTPFTGAHDDLAEPNAGQKAHQADGTDSSASFEAGIADEGTIPEAPQA
jgi:hypothetical protein